MPSAGKRIDPLAHALVFVVYFIAAHAFLWVYYTFQTSPALVWPPVAIGFLAVLLGGYYMGVPVFLAQFAAVVMWNPKSALLVGCIALGYALQSIFGVYLVRKLGFENRLERLRNMQILIGAAFVVTMIEPAIALTSGYFLGALTVGPTEYFGRAWGAGIFSVLVLAPLVLTWYPFARVRLSKPDWGEVALAFTTLIVADYFLFCTTYPQHLGITVIFILPAALTWFALRLDLRWTSLAIFISAAIGVLGTIVSNPSSQPLNTQLLAVQIYIGLTAAIFYVLAAVVDERRQAYKSLQEAYEATASADKAKNDFIAVLAHELRNPLAPIVSSLELLKLQPQTPESAETIENIEQHTHMIRRLLDDILDTARFSHQKFRLQKETVALRDIIEQSVASVRDFARSKRHTMNVHIKDDLAFYADHVRVKQIVINLLNNSVKYTEPGGRIDLTAERIDSDVRIRVVDTGMGISRETLPLVFEPFKQGARSSRVGTGLGIGLYLTKRIAEAHGGRVEAWSEGQGRGSTFDLYLPLEYTVARTLPTRARPTAAPSRILIVDDNAAAAKTLARLLTHHHHEVEIAYSGNDALSALQSFKPETLFLDIGLPDIDGYSVARRIRASGWNGTIAALTGYGQDADRAQSLEAGIDHHLVKPVSVGDVLGVLKPVPTVVA